MSRQIALDAINLRLTPRLALAPECSGLMWAVGNHIPYNVPIDIAEKYIDYLKANWQTK